VVLAPRARAFPPARAVRAASVVRASRPPAWPVRPRVCTSSACSTIPAPCLAALGRAARADRASALPCRDWPAGSALTRALATQAPPRSESAKVCPSAPTALSRARACPGGSRSSRSLNRNFNCPHARPELCSAGSACCAHARSPRCFRAGRQHSEQRVTCRGAVQPALRTAAQGLQPDVCVLPAGRCVCMCCRLPWKLVCLIAQFAARPYITCPPLPSSLPPPPPHSRVIPWLCGCSGLLHHACQVRMLRAMTAWGPAGRAGPAREHGAAAAAAAERRPSGLGGRGVGEPAGRAAPHLLQPLAQHGADPRGRLRHGGAPAAPHPLSLSPPPRHPPTSPARSSSP
jgi:hypothetical protein